MEKRKNNAQDYDNHFGINPQKRYGQFISRLIEILLICLAAFMPFAFGVVQPWSEQVVVVLSSALILLFILYQIIRPEKGFTRTWAYLPVILFISIIFLQLVPLPEKITSVLSPQTVTLKKELLNQAGQAQQQLSNFTISFYPSATKHDLRLVLAVVCVFVVVLNVFRTYEQIKRLLKAIVYIGGAVAALAILQDIAGADKIYWFINTPLKANSGPFINHSHFGQFMNLSIGAAAALLLLKLQEDFENRQTTAVEVFEYFDSSGSRNLWALAGMISISAAAVFVSLTRGGMFSMIMAMCITVLLLAIRGNLRQHGWLVFAIALGAFVCLLYTGFDAVYDRFATLSTLDKYSTRLEIVKDLLKPAKQFAVLGTGLGTHSVIYPMFQSISTALRFSHAENEYMQLIEETGITGFIIMLSFGVIIIINFIKAIRNKKSPLSIAAYGLGFGVTAILIHSISDFGQHLPANAMLTAIFCALIIVLADYHKTPQNVQPSRLKKPILIILLPFILCICIWSVIGAYRANLANRYWQKSCKIEDALIANHRQGTDSDFENLIFYTTKAVQIQPDNIEYRCWLNIWKWWNIRRETDPSTDVLPNESIKEVYEIVDDLQKSRSICPTFGPLYCLLGQLQKFVLCEPAGEDNIKKGFMLEPNDEITLFAAGCLDVSEDDSVRAFEKFRKSVQLGGTFFKEIVSVYIEQAERPDLAIEIAADNTRRLKYVIDVLSRNEETAALVETAKTKLIELAEQKASKNTADISELIMLGDYYGKNKNGQKAIEYFNAAVAADYGNAMLRLKLAQALADNGQADEAIGQLRICLKLRPKYWQAEKLLQELSVRPEVVKKNIENK